MKIIQGMKRLNVIEKKVEKNRRLISTYSSYSSLETPEFGSEKDQKKEVSSLVQANNDLFSEWLKIKTAIEKTNLDTTVEIGAFKYSISELLSIKHRGIGNSAKLTYEALTPQTGFNKVREAQQYDISNPPKVVLAYDPKTKDDKIDELEDFLGAIDSTLEVVNAETDLIGFDN